MKNLVKTNSGLFSRFGPLLFLVLVTASVIFSLPFLKSSDFSWAEMNPYLQGMVFCLTSALFCHACLSFRIGNTLLLFIVSFLVSYAAEATGIRWAWPFSSLYHYHPAINPKLPGAVPLCIPLMWFMLTYTALVFLRPFSVRPSGSLAWGRMLLKAALCGLYIMATDFVIDPLGILFKGWFWHEPGAYFGVPSGNFAGWFWVGFVICGCTFLLEKPILNDRVKNRIVLDGLFVAVSIFLTMLCFAGFIIHIGSALPVALSLTVMGPCWVYWAVSISSCIKKRI